MLGGGRRAAAVGAAEARRTIGVVLARIRYGIAGVPTSYVTRTIQIKSARPFARYHSEGRFGRTVGLAARGKATKATLRAIRMYD